MIRKSRFTLWQDILIKIIEGVFLTMSMYVTKRMNIYIAFAMLMMISIISWTVFMIKDWVNYTFFEVLNSSITNTPLAVLSILTIISFKIKELRKYRFTITFLFLLYTFGNGTYFLIVDLMNSANYSNNIISMWAFITDVVMALGGMFLLLLILDDRDVENKNGVHN
ncbi:hypothetical protein [Fangia hongkongensis]|uniref:hypothetical protein n=2 Tax=Fangia hongkongensis TaxID=270495 RepID=UPI0003743749|nr:hypothetical protein [Fangia hongkongensis]